MQLGRQLQSVRSRYEEIARQLQEPAVAADGARYRSLMKEYKELTPLAQAYDAYEAACRAGDEARALLEEGGLDEELKQLARAQLEESTSRAQALEGRLKVLLLPRDARDERSVIVEIRAGAGGDEAALFAHSLQRMYALYAQSRGWKVELLNENATELGGAKEVSFSVEGQGAFSRMKYESGVHRVQRVPETETQGRIHTSTVTVAVMPQAEEVEVVLDPAD